MTRKQAPRNFTRYVVNVENKTVHGGITEGSLHEQVVEHKRKWPTCRVRKVGPKVTEKTAREWETAFHYHYPHYLRLWDKRNNP